MPYSDNFSSNDAVRMITEGHLESSLPFVSMVTYSTYSMIPEEYDVQYPGFDVSISIYGENKSGAGLTQECRFEQWELDEMSGDKFIRVLQKHYIDLMKKLGETVDFG